MITAQSRQPRPQTRSARVPRCPTRSAAILALAACTALLLGPSNAGASQRFAKKRRVTHVPYERPAEYSQRTDDWKYNVLVKARLHQEKRRRPGRSVEKGELGRNFKDLTQLFEYLAFCPDHPAFREDILNIYMGLTGWDRPNDTTGAADIVHFPSHSGIQGVVVGRAYLHSLEPGSVPPSMVMVARPDWWKKPGQTDPSWKQGDLIKVVQSVTLGSHLMEVVSAPPSEFSVLAEGLE